ncbi:hypothetical protein NA57DRAFT_80997 [Rhizodiscina lignyota]|uniref:Uncharacterized protein n=1 Tax=Rhizodiscina lignyota TaxID=1504668 RepID=A0A9P4I7T5_9PEZI|nr:hypothetical protein NA57DRAFT_80997 [Rhizodiscina lignyota]
MLFIQLFSLIASIAATFATPVDPMSILNVEPLPLNMSLPLTLPRRDAPVCGKMTYYNTGLGSCGITNNDGENLVALADIHQSEKCGKNIRITHSDTGTSIDAPVQDTCPVCTYASGEENVVADLSPALFNALGGGDGHFQGCFYFL